MLYAYAAKDNGVNGSACREGEPAPPTHPHAHLVDEDVVAIQLEAVLVVDHGWLDREKTPDDEVLQEEGGGEGGASKGGGGRASQGPHAMLVGGDVRERVVIVSDVKGPYSQVRHLPRFPSSPCQGGVPAALEP